MKIITGHTELIFIFCYLSKEHSFIHVSFRQSHCLLKSLKDKDLSWACSLCRFSPDSSVVQTLWRYIWHSNGLCSIHKLFRFNNLIKTPTCAVMRPASCMSATSAELLRALREWIRGLSGRGIGPASSKGETWAWWSRGWTGWGLSYHSREPGRESDEKQNGKLNKLVN